MQKVKQFIEKIQELKSNRNEGELSIFDLMNDLQKTEIWKRDDFYDDTDIDVKEWKDAKFSFILRHLAGWTISHFLSIQAVVTMENDRDIFIKYGYQNSVALKNMSKKERPQILTAVETHIESHSIIPGFYEIINKVFPNRRQTRPITDGNEAKTNNIIAENKKLKKQFKDLIEKFELLKIENNNLIAENKKLREQVIKKFLKLG